MEIIRNKTKTFIKLYPHTYDYSTQKYKAKRREKDKEK